MSGLEAWVRFAEAHQRHQQLEAAITRVVDFGLFVGLDGGIEGLVHLGDMSWTEAGEAAIKRYSEGDRVRVAILSIDAERQRISLGIKQCAPNPWRGFADQHAVGDRVIARIRTVHARSLVVDLGSGLTGAVDLPASRAGDADYRFETGESISLVIVEISVRRGRVTLSLDGGGGGRASMVEIAPVKPNPRPSPDASAVAAATREPRS